MKNYEIKNKKNISCNSLRMTTKIKISMHEGVLQSNTSKEELPLLVFEENILNFDRSENSEYLPLI